MRRGSQRTVAPDSNKPLRNPRLFAKRSFSGSLTNSKAKTTLYPTLTAIYMVLPPRLIRNRTDEPFFTESRRFWQSRMSLTMERFISEMTSPLPIDILLGIGLVKSIISRDTMLLKSNTNEYSKYYNTKYDYELALPIWNTFYNKNGSKN